MRKFLLAFVMLFVTLFVAGAAYAQGGQTTIIRYGPTLPTLCTANAENLFGLTTGTKGLYQSLPSTTTCAWTVVSSSAAVTSVFTRIGGVVATTGDYTFAQISGSLACSQEPALTGA